jgi:drug/metabolite transporter (DMT)-like permease
VLAALWCGIAGTGATYTLWNSALRHLPASRVAPAQYLISPFGLLFAWLILAEVPSPILLAATALILLGVALAQQPWQQRRRAT